MDCNKYRRGSVRVIDIIEKFDLGFTLGIAFKHIARSRSAGTSKARQIEELLKAQWYIAERINALKAGK